MPRPAEADAFVQRAIAQVRDVLLDVQRAYRVGPPAADAADVAGHDALVQHAIAQVLEVLQMSKSQPRGHDAQDQHKIIIILGERCQLLFLHSGECGARCNM
jgi:hypothetical protein